MPLRLRLALLFSLATAVAVLAAGLAFLSQLRDNLYDGLDSALQARMADTIHELQTDDDLPVFAQGDQPTEIEKVAGGLIASSPAAKDIALPPDVRAQAQRGDVLLTLPYRAGRARVLVSAPKIGTDRVLITIGADAAIADQALERVRAALTFGGPLVVLLAGAAAWLLAGAALRPVERMRAEAARIGTHDLEHRLPVPSSRDEIASLAATMNMMLDRLTASATRDRRFVADASHELRTPLAILRAELELAGRPGRSFDELREAVRGAGLETNRLIRLAEDLLLLARSDNRRRPLRVATVRLRDLLEDAVRHGRGQIHDVQIACPADLRVTVDPDQIARAAANLIDNAVVHSPRDAPVQVGVTADHTGVTIDVLDRGPGLPPDFLPRAFERFERAEDSRDRATGGAGLGLSIVKSVCEMHGGSAMIANRAYGGAQATIQLPPTIINGAANLRVTEVAG